MKHLLSILIIMIAFVIGCKKDEKAGNAAVTTAAVTNITVNSAQSGGTITSNGGSVISRNGVCFALHNNPTVSDSITNDGTGAGSFTSSLTNLNANTKYYVRAYAINGSGTGYGNVDSFTTLKGVPTVTTTAISNNQDLAAYSGGDVTNDGGASVISRGLCWSTSPHPTISDFKTTDGSGTGNFVDSLVKLNLTTYYVRAYATNSFGTGYGNEISFTVNSAGYIGDIEGNVYATVVIGTQTWMGSNLKTGHYQNGDPITDGTSVNYDWAASSNYLVGAYSFPNDDSANNGTYGKYYNQAAVNDPRNICPSGWHIPSDGEWETLEFYEGMAASDTGSFGLRGTIGGNLLTGGSTGLNIQTAGYMIYGLAGQPGAYQSFGNGSFGICWTSSLQGDSWPPVNGATVNNFLRAFNVAGSGPIYRQATEGWTVSVRCMKN